MENIAQAELPPKKEIYLFTKLSENQLTLYKELISKATSIPDSETNKNNYLNILMQFRQVCNHPYLVSGKGDKKSPGYVADLIKSSGKMMVLDKLLEKLFNEKRQVVIFCQMTKFLDVLQAYCVGKNYQYCRIDGNVEKDQRREQVEEFVKAGSEKFLFCLTTRTGGYEMNLSTADTVIMYDNDMNPTIDDYAIQRVYIAGQKNPVTVYRMMIEDTIEERLWELQKEGVKLDEMIWKEEDETALIEMLKSVVTYRADEFVAGSLNSAEEEFGKIIAEGNIEDYLEKCENKTKEIDAKHGRIKDRIDQKED